MANFSNEHTSCTAAGLAINDGKCYYISAAGPATSTQSIWACLFNNASQGARAPQWWSRYQTFHFKGEKGVRTIWQNLPECTYKHFVSRSPDPNLLLLVDPKAAVMSESDRIALRLQRIDEVQYRFFIWLKKHVDVPVLQEWVPHIWDDVTGRGMDRVIKPIHTWGDCVGAWLLNPEAGWDKYIADKVTRGKLSF